MRRALYLLLPALALTAACTSGKPAPSPTGAGTPTPAPTPTEAPELALARLAAQSQRASYTASYAVTGGHPGTMRIVRVPTGYRFELTTDSGANRRKAVLIQTKTRTVSCTVIPAPVLCFQVAGPGKPVPAVFDAGLQHVFSDYLVKLSRHSSEYDVQPAAPGGRDGACFRVTVVASPAPAGSVAAGTYCFASNGVPTRVVYPSGELVLLKIGPAPKAGDFAPPAHPKPLP